MASPPRRIQRAQPNPEGSNDMPVDPASTVPTQESGRDRRRWPRAKADWPITLDLPEGRYEARVRDISQAGVCFFLNNSF